MELEAEVALLLAQMPEGCIDMSQDDMTGEVARACRHMQQHGLIAQRMGTGSSGWARIGVSFYANSIAHYLPNGQKSDCCRCKE